MMISPKYEVLAEIGRGGMGIVYRVRHTSLDAVFALKILPAHLAEDAELVSRFHREARVMAKLHHANIVRVIDVDKSGDLHYFVMEYVEGRSLDKIIADQGPRSLPEVLDLAVQVARAVAHAHAHDPAVIHRDLKPANILVEVHTGRAVVTDFGLAKLAGGTESIQTETGKFMGTLRYCAPEQLAGSSEVDGRVDVYALGMAIYEAYAGRSAYVDFERPHVIAGLLQLTTEHPFQFDATVPEGFRQLILRATAKDRDQRYPTAKALLADLEGLVATLPQPTSEHTTSGQVTAVAALPAQVARSRGRMIAAVATLAVGIATAGVVSMRSLFDAPEGAGSGPFGGGTAAGGGVTAIKQEENVRKFVSVMDFALRSPDQQFRWMCDVIRDNLTSRLSSSPDCKVFSKEFLDFKAQQMVREGRYQDAKAAAMEVAEKLGVSKAILGSVRAERDTLRIEAHLVDMGTGVQETSEVVEGQQSEFAELQARLAEKLMMRLGVTPPPSMPETVQAAEAGADLENYRLLLQAEGQESPVEPKPVPTKPRPDEDRRGDVGPADRLSMVFDAVVADAFADEVPETAATAETEIRDTLERYRRACEEKNVSALAEVYDHLSQAQIDANRRYFENARDLAVAFEEIDVAIGENEAAVSYTRRDRFIDRETERPTKVDVRLTKMLVRIEGRWKLSSGRAPGQ